MAEFNSTGGSASGPADAASAADGSALKDEAGKLADKSVSTGVEAAQAVGKAAESAAQALDESLPMLAGYVRNAAQHTNEFADSLRDKKAEELSSTAVTWARQQPLLTMAGAAVLGFALSRIAKSGLAATTAAEPARRHDGYTDADRRRPAMNDEPGLFPCLERHDQPRHRPGSTGGAGFQGRTGREIEPGEGRRIPSSRAAPSSSRQRCSCCYKRPSWRWWKAAFRRRWRRCWWRRAIAIGLAFMLVGRRQVDGDALAPERTIHGLQRDTRLVKEKLS